MYCVLKKPKYKTTGFQALGEFIHFGLYTSFVTFRSLTKYYILTLFAWINNQERMDHWTREFEWIQSTRCVYWQTTHSVFSLLVSEDRSLVSATPRVASSLSESPIAHSASSPPSSLLPASSPLFVYTTLHPFSLTPHFTHQIARHYFAEAFIHR